VWTLIFGRMVIGIAAGIGWIVGAMLIAEVSTAKHRGAVLSVLSICFGVGVATGTTLSLPGLLGTHALWPLAMSLGMKGNHDSRVLKFTKLPLIL
jgi:MFS family permease